MKQWTIEELHAELARFERELTEAGKADATVRTYVDRSETFLRFLVGDYEPDQSRR